ncbi:hypothetical protein XENOCAPTIV_011022 [Xenoophorus captivus]|uniref:Uncharacterized protein n=1 Tax=Xenoophorus captivus TaxID=1517983 RepID=A0ABV0QW84_9TELE
MDIVAICRPKYKDRPQIAQIVQKTRSGYSIHWMTGSYNGPWTVAKKRDGRKKVPWVDNIKESDIIYKKISLTSGQKLTNKVAQTLRALYAAKDGSKSKSAVVFPAMPSAAGASSPAAALAEALDNSARLIDRHLQDDRYFPDLSELLSVPSHMSDMDYPLQGPGLLSVPNLPELSAVRRVPLPPELVEQFSRVRLYFTTTPFAPQHQKHVAVRPSLLALVHVRLPPGFSASSTLQKPSKVHKALHSKVDQLRHLLVSCAGGESEEVERFFKLHRVLLLFNVLYHCVVPPAFGTPFEPMQSGSAPITPMSAGPEVIFSGKHNGICIYFARILG